MAKSTQIASRGVEFQLNPNPFPRTGYTLLGWNQDWRSDEVEYEDGARVTFDGDRDLYALWQINQYWVMFNANGGTGGWVEPRKMEYGAEVTAPEVIRTGHTFVEWSPPAPETVPPNDITCMAQWQVNQYRVTFDAAGGSGGWSQLQDYGSAIVPPEVTRGGYEFIEWQPSVDATVPDRDVEYVAQWQRLSCTVYFDTGDAGTTIEPKVVLQGDPVGELPSAIWPKPQGLAGMQFAGWWTRAEDGNPVTESTIVPIGYTSVTIHAHWEGVIHYQRVSKNTENRVEIDSNGVASGFGGSDNPSNMVQCALESIPDDKFDFSGEFTIVMKAQVKTNRRDINCGAVLPDSGGLTKQCSSWDVFGCYWVHDSQNYYCDFGLLMEAQSGNNIKYTQWEIASDYNDKRTVGPFYSYGTGLNQTAPAGWATKPFLLGVTRRYVDSKWVIRTYLSMDDGLNWTLEYENTNAMQPLAPGQFCIGNDSDSYSEYFPGSIFLNECYLVQENANSAQPRGKYKLHLLEAAQYVVTLDEQGGHGGDTSVLATYAQDMPQIEIPTRTGYTFNGYYDQPQGEGEKYYNSVGGSKRHWDKTNGATLYAKWTANTYTVTFDAQGGVGGTSQATLNYGATMPTIELPTRTGYIFGGYFTEPDGQGTQYYSTQGQGMGAWNETSDTILYARWIEDWVTITMDDNAPEELVVTFNSSTASDGISVTFDSGLRENEINVTFATDGVPNPIHVRFTDDNQAT